MPAKVIRKIIDDYKQSDDEKLNLNDQGLTNILEIPELGNASKCTLNHIYYYYDFFYK